MTKASCWTHGQEGFSRKDLESDSDREVEVLYEFAITPDAFDAASLQSDGRLEVSLVEFLRGLNQNGLLANLHKDRLVRHIEDRLAGLRPSLRDKVAACLSNLKDRHRIVRHPRRPEGDPVGDIEWLDLALRSHVRIPFHGIVTTHLLAAAVELSDPAIVELGDILDSMPWQNRRRTRTIRKCEADYRLVFSSILRHARSVCLVDPYLSAREAKWFAMVQLCSELAGLRANERLSCRIDVHAEAKTRQTQGETPDDFVATFRARLAPLIDIYQHRYRVFLWESLPGSDKFHDRFVLTDQCGVQVPYGLDLFAAETASPTTLGLLDEEDRLYWLQKVAPGVSPYRLLKELKVPEEAS
jgi:hypothetical protein